MACMGVRFIFRIQGLRRRGLGEFRFRAHGAVQSLRLNSKILFISMGVKTETFKGGFWKISGLSWAGRLKVLRAIPQLIWNPKTYTLPHTWHNDPKP